MTSSKHEVPVLAAAGPVGAAVGRRGLVVAPTRHLARAVDGGCR
ncbi:MAG: hypothetical protein AAFY78_11030 [Cyanobacteria bacterium J06648_16]